MLTANNVSEQLVSAASHESTNDDHTVHFLEQVSGLVTLAINNLLMRQALAGEEELHKISASGIAQPMDRARNKFFSRSRFSQDQNCGIAGRDW